MYKNIRHTFLNILKPVQTSTATAIIRAILATISKIPMSVETNVPKMASMSPIRKISPETPQRKAFGRVLTAVWTISWMCLFISICNCNRLLMTRVERNLDSNNNIIRIRLVIGSISSVFEGEEGYFGRVPTVRRRKNTSNLDKSGWVLNFALMARIGQHIGLYPVYPILEVRGGGYA